MDEFWMVQPCDLCGIDTDALDGLCDTCYGSTQDDTEDDSWDDADSLVSIGWGTDEDYGYFGE